jgi:hypothetical protein
LALSRGWATGRRSGLIGNSARSDSSDADATIATSEIRIRQPVGDGRRRSLAPAASTHDRTKAPWTTCRGGRSGSRGGRGLVLLPDPRPPRTPRRPGLEGTSCRIPIRTAWGYGVGTGGLPRQAKRAQTTDVCLSNAVSRPEWGGSHPLSVGHEKNVPKPPRPMPV